MLRNLVAYLSRVIIPEQKIFLVGDTVRLDKLYGSVIHPKEFEDRTNTIIHRPKSLLKGIEVCLELSNGEFTRYSTKYLVKIDPYAEMEHLTEMRHKGWISQDYLVENISFLERVAEKAFYYPVYS